MTRIGCVREATSNIKRRMIREGLCLILFLSSVFLSSPAGSQETEYTLGVVPQYASSAIYKAWLPFAEYLAHRTGITIKLKLSKSFPEFERDLADGAFDFVFMNPYQQARSREKQGYIPLVHDSADRLTGILVVLKDSPITSVKELDGAKIVFPSPNSFAASLYPRALLIAQEKISFTPEYVNTHDNVYRHVIVGRATAGGGVRKTFQKQPRAVQEQLRVIYETPGVTPHPFSAHPRVPENVRQDVVMAILDLSQTREGSQMLADISISQPTAANYYRDYGDLEKLELDRYRGEDVEE